MKKKMMLSLAAVAMVGTLAVGGTLAWFTDTETATNVVTLGNVNIQWDEDGTDIVGDTTGLDFGENRVPGASFNKNAKIENVGANDAYVRATIAYKVDDQVVTTLPDAYEVEIKAGEEGSKWQFKDGYYYYLEKVNAKGETDLLVGTVSIKNTAGNDVAGQKFEIVLNAEAIQADNVWTGDTDPATVDDFVTIFSDKTFEDYDKYVTETTPGV